MIKVAIIGGTGLDQLSALENLRTEQVDTPYGKTSNALNIGSLNGNEVIFLPRHGEHHDIAPHNINYRANLWALKEQGATHIIAVNAVGGITEKMSPEKIIFPDQIIDYTHSREHTFSDENADTVLHIDFTQPYSSLIRGVLRSTAVDMAIDFEGEAVYGAAQGPRLETAAEINRMQQDGCDIVGMTGMPEASLARELGIEYACCALVVNWAAGKGENKYITMDIIEQHMQNGMVHASKLISNALPELLNL
ncbi:MAG: S-methyl-5'-thioinosine phosphorylase [Gammaproteobacteria bacterium]|nr:S-methyl-5'-thioinosine phosphorylase [Gammaproteobacteria bacterium]MCW8923373.1 S-methyl-5'-thioinosine phosphorylase [Gammaproteobacteria bacterium]